MLIRNTETMEAALREARKHAREEYVSLQIAGRFLTREEKQRSEVLEKSLRYIDEALGVIITKYGRTSLVR